MTRLLKSSGNRNGGNLDRYVQEALESVDTTWGECWVNAVAFAQLQHYSTPLF